MNYTENIFFHTVKCGILQNLRILFWARIKLQGLYKECYGFVHISIATA